MTQPQTNHQQTETLTAENDSLPESTVAPATQSWPRRLQEKIVSVGKFAGYSWPWTRTVAYIALGELGMIGWVNTFYETTFWQVKIFSIIGGTAALLLWLLGCTLVFALMNRAISKLRLRLR